jgi:hypothetical protein
MFKDAKDYDVKLPKVAWNKGFDHLDPETRARVNKVLIKASPVKKGYTFAHGKKYNGKSIAQLAAMHKCDRATIEWHISRWGNLERLKQDYHKNRAKLHWGKTVKEWTAFINDPKLNTGCVRNAINLGKDKFERYIFKKTGKQIRLTNNHKVV